MELSPQRAMDIPHNAFFSLWTSSWALAGTMWPNMANSFYFPTTFPAAFDELKRRVDDDDDEC
jgi:hypothetical protein